MLGEGTKAHVLGAGKALFYAERTWPAIVNGALSAGADPREIEALKAFVATSAVDQKRADALALIALMNERFTGKTEPRRVPWAFQPTIFWERIRRSVEAPEPA